MKTIKKSPSLSLLFIFTNVACIYAQEIEVTNSEVYIRSQNTYGYLRFFNSGELLLDKSGVNYSNALSINVNHSNVKALAIYNQWQSPHAFTVYGDGTAYLLSTAVTSDSTLKKNIIKLGSQIENVKKLNGVSFNWKADNLKGEKQTYGLLAQDLEKVYPDMVFTNDQTNSKNELYQNVPNPFTGNTRIDYFLSDDVKNAAISIYTLNGTQLKNIPLHLKGNGNVIISGNEMKAGMYLYALIADGKVIDTKRMVLTD